MAQRNKFQGKDVRFESIDQELSMDVEGQMFVGYGSKMSAITTANQSHLVVGTDGNSHMVLTTRGPVNTGILEINNVQWPANYTELQDSAMMFVEFDQADSQFKLKYAHIVVGQTDSDTATSTSLITKFPNAKIGQMVTGPNATYLCTARHTWRAIGGVDTSGLTLPDQTGNAQKVLSTDGTNLIWTAINSSGTGSTDVITALTAAPISLVYDAPSPYGSSITLTRNAGYTGGSVGYVNSALFIDTNVKASASSFEWGLTSRINNHASAGENVGGYLQGNKYSTGPTWGGCMEVNDKTNADTTANSGGVVGLEVDVWANGADNYEQRIGIDVVVGKSTSGGTKAYAYDGVRIGAQGNANASAEFKYGVNVLSAGGSSFLSQATGTRGVELRGTYVTAIDTSLSTNSTNTAIRIKSGDYIALDGSDTVRMKYNPTSGYIEFYSGAARHGYIDINAGADRNFNSAPSGGASSPIVSIKDFGATGNGTGNSDNSALVSAQTSAASVYIPEGNYIVSVAPKLGVCWGPGKVYLNNTSPLNLQYVHPTPGPIDTILLSVFSPPETTSQQDATPYIQRAIDLAQANNLKLLFPSGKDYLLNTGLTAKAGSSGSFSYNVSIDFNNCILRPGPGIIGLHIVPQCTFADVGTGRSVSKISLKNVEWDYYFSNNTTTCMKIGLTGYQISAVGYSVIENVTFNQSNWVNSRATAVVVSCSMNIDWRRIVVASGSFVITSDAGGQFCGDMKFYSCVFCGTGGQVSQAPLVLRATGGNSSTGPAQVRGINFTNCYVYGTGTLLQSGTSGDIAQVGDIYFTDCQWDPWLNVPMTNNDVVSILTYGQGTAFNIHLTNAYFVGFHSTLINAVNAGSGIDALNISGLYMNGINSVASSLHNSLVNMSGVGSFNIHNASLNTITGGNSSSSAVSVSNSSNFVVSGMVCKTSNSLNAGVSINAGCAAFSVYGNMFNTAVAVSDQSVSSAKQISLNMVI